MNYHAVKHGLDLLEGVFLIRRLSPYYRNIGKRLVKAPRVYLRDTGLLHHLLNIGTAMDLDLHPGRCASWEGFVIEDLIRREQLIRPYTQFFFWRTATGHEADLIMDRGNERIAIEVKSNSGTNPHDARRLESVLDDIGGTRGYLLGMWAPSEKISSRVSNISLETNPGWLPD